jgi:nicotinamide-nucleotide amidase
MIAEIICIGDELLVGQVINTNAAWIAQHLNEIGITVGQISDIPDEAAHIKSAIDLALSRSDVVLMTGGLGPTKDDITKHTLCEYFHTELVMHQASLDNIYRLFPARGLKVSDVNRQQALVPANCLPLLNEQGTAPGMWFEKDHKILVSMPGVPFEMEGIMTIYVLPRLAGAENGRVIVNRTVLTQGIGESALAELIKDWEDKLPENMKLAYLPQPGMVRLRLTAFNHTKEEGLQEIDRQLEELKALIPGYIFGYDNDTLESLTGRLLKEKNMTVCTAESCTGGYLAHLITSVPGSSAYYCGSVIAYSNRVKQEMLGVSGKTLEEYGAVSEQVVIEMAEGARIKFNTDFAVSLSGIAGPDGGTAEKPVGTVWIAVASPEKTIAKKFMFGEHRGRNIRRAALAALNMLRVEGL